jgi:hypothetical protein
VTAFTTKRELQAYLSRRIGPLPIFDFRVLALTVLLLAPVLRSSRLIDHWISGPLLCMSIEAFL